MSLLPHVNEIELLNFHPANLNHYYPDQSTMFPYMTGNMACEERREERCHGTSGRRQAERGIQPRQ